MMTNQDLIKTARASKSTEVVHENPEFVQMLRRVEEAAARVPMTPIQAHFLYLLENSTGNSLVTHRMEGDNLTTIVLDRGEGLVMVTTYEPDGSFYSPEFYQVSPERAEPIYWDATKTGVDKLLGPQ
jgi:hypothetical protein